MAPYDDPDTVEMVSIGGSNTVRNGSDTSPNDPRNIFDLDVDFPLESNAVIINNRWVVPAPPDEHGLEVVDNHSLRDELCPWETLEPGYRDQESIEFSEEDLDRDTFPAYPKTWHLRVQRAVALEVILSARREVIQLGLPGAETDKLLEDLDLREQSMRRPQHRDILEVASEIKGIDPDSTAAEHETARQRWKEEIQELRARVTEDEAAEKATTKALVVTDAKIRSPLLWSAGGVAFVVVLASIFLAWWVASRKAAGLPQSPQRLNASQ